jgi:hypothetical protein
MDNLTFDWRQDMNDDLNSSLDYLWEMLTDKGLYMEANIVALAQNRIEELEARVYIHVSAMAWTKSRYKETLKYLGLSDGDKTQ